MTCECASVPRDPLAPVLKAVEELDSARAGVSRAREDARALVDRARERERMARATLHQRIVDAAQAGVRPTDLVHASGLTREAVRRILRAGGVGPD